MRIFPYKTPTNTNTIHSKYRLDFRRRAVEEALTRISGRQYHKMSSNVDYLLHESSVGYAIFQVVHQADTIGNRLKEVQDAGQDLAKFGKMVKLVNFAPYR